MSFEQERNYNKQKSHSNENTLNGIQTTEALAFQQEQNPIQFQNQNKEQLLQFDYGNQNKDIKSGIQYFQNNTEKEDTVENILGKENGLIKRHKKSNSDENIIMQNSQEISVKLNSQKQFSDDDDDNDENFKSIGIHHSNNNSEILSDDDDVQPTKNQSNNVDQFQDFNNFGQIQQKQQKQFDNNQINKKMTNSHHSQQQNQQNGKRKSDIQIFELNNSNNKDINNKEINNKKINNSNINQYYSQNMKSAEQINQLQQDQQFQQINELFNSISSHSNYKNSSNLYQSSKNSKSVESSQMVPIPMKNIIQKQNFYKNESMIDQKNLLEIVQDYIKFTNFWYFFSYFVFLITFIALLIYIFFPNRKSNTVGLISVLIQFFDSGFTLLGSRYGKKVFKTFNYRLILQCQKYFIFSFIPQVISIILSEVFFILADKSNQALFMLYIFFYQLLQIFMIYSKIYQVVKKGQDLSDLIRAFEIQQSQDPEAPHLRQLVTEKIFKKSADQQQKQDEQIDNQKSKQNQQHEINFEFKNQLK